LGGGEEAHGRAGKGRGGGGAAMVRGWPAALGLAALGALAAQAAGEGLGEYYSGDDLVPLEWVQQSSMVRAAGLAVRLPGGESYSFKQPGSQGGGELWTTDEGVTSPPTGERIGRENWVEEGQMVRKLMFTFNSKDEGYEFSTIEAMDANMEDTSANIDPKQYVPGKMLFFCHRFEVSLVDDFGDPAGTLVANNFSAGGVLGSYSSADIPPYNPCPGQECSYVDGDITCKNITRVIYEDAPPEEEKSKATLMYIILGSCGGVVVVLVYSIVLMMNQRNNAQYRQQAAALAIRIRQGKAAEAAEAMAI